MKDESSVLFEKRQEDVSRKSSDSQSQSILYVCTSFFLAVKQEEEEEGREEKSVCEKTNQKQVPKVRPGVEE